MIQQTVDGRFVLPDGRECKMGMVQPQVLRYAAVPAWDEANEILPESQWEEHDDLAQFMSPIKYQHYSNCTNASWAGQMEVAMRAAGFPNVEPLSMSFLWSHFNGGNGNNGCMCREVAEMGRRVGCPRASLWPENKVSARGGVSQEVLDDAAMHAAFEVYQCLDWRQVASALTRRFTVYHGFVLGGSFFSTRGDGKVPAWDGRTINGHAMFSRGLTRRFGDWRAITPNTWDRSFGDQGVGYIDPSYFWAERGNFVNLEAFAIRAVKVTAGDPLPSATT